MTTPTDADARLASQAGDTKQMPDAESRAATPIENAASDLRQTLRDLVHSTIEHHNREKAARRTRANTAALRARNFQD